MEKYFFRNKLREGLIKSRPNRFIMMVQLDDIVERCHCPSTGQIGSLEFRDIPCLVSEADNPERATRFTVEAISLDSSGVKKKSWIGINQTRANEYVEFFLKRGMLEKMFPKVSEIRREAKLHDSRIDFLINGRDFIEVKTLLMDLPSEGHANYRKRTSKFAGFDRLIKHFGDLTKGIKKGARAVLLMCYLYDARPFSVPKANREPRIMKAAQKSWKEGLENWQINLKVDEFGVEMIDYFRLNLS